jgi:hypothetical protein
MKVQSLTHSEPTCFDILAENIRLRVQANNRDLLVALRNEFEPFFRIEYDLTGERFIAVDFISDEGANTFSSKEMLQQHAKCFTRHPTRAAEWVTVFDHTTKTAKQHLGRLDPFAAVHAIRTVRNICEYLLGIQGFIKVHSSAVATPSGAILFVGDKFAGKTTSMIAAVLAGVGDIMANDEVFIQPQKDSVMIRALPMAASIRSSTLRNFFELNPLLLDPTSYHAENVSNEDATTAPQLYIRPNKLADLLGCKLIGSSTARWIVFPRFEVPLQESRLRAVSNSVGMARLTTHVILEPNDPFWNRQIKHSCPAPTETLKSIERSVEFFELDQSGDTCRRSGQLLKAL